MRKVFCLLALLLATSSTACLAFHPQPPPLQQQRLQLVQQQQQQRGFDINTNHHRHHHHAFTLLGASSVPPPAILGIPLLGRFRKKREIDQTKLIAVGDQVPNVDVEILQSKGENGTIVTSIVSIRDVLGNQTAVLVGMPGAFTPVCTQKHLPGYINAAPRLAELGIDKIAVVTTNDRYVNQEWSNQFGLLSSAGEGKESVVTVLCDGDGDLVRSMGLADDMGFGVGTRSKRFALVAENGIISTLLLDDGMDDCSKTSADSLLRVLAPELAKSDSDAAPLSNVVIGAGVAVVALVAALASSLTGGGGGSVDSSRLLAPTTGTASPVIRNEPAKKLKPGSGKSSFSLLNEYL